MDQPPLDPQSPLDPFAGYLEVVSVIGILQAKRERMLENSLEMPVLESDVAALVARVEAGIGEAQSLQAEYEQRMEDALQSAADRADTLRVLFASVSSRMAEMREWISDAVNGLPAEDREDWDMLVSDYEHLRAELGGALPPE